MFSRNGRVLSAERRCLEVPAARISLQKGDAERLGVLAAFVGFLVELGCGAEWTNADVILSQGNSVSAAKWLASSSFDDNCPMHLATARSFADFCLSKGINHFTQWFPERRTPWPTFSPENSRCPTKRSQS
jgi:hypothetical protein